MGVVSRGDLLRRASTLLALLPTAFLPVPASLWGTAAIDAHPVGQSVTAIIEFGDEYLGSELYDAKITVFQVIRGEKAWDIVKRASASNRAPKPGFEYLLARVHFGFSARTSPAHYSYKLNEIQFTATGANGREFDAPTLAVPPQPGLSGTLKPGDSLEGWLVFLVPQNVSEPVMVFHEDVGIVSHTGGGTWFRLYERPIDSRQGKL
jgi:Domain of unknown function (DUF4352)